MTDHDDEVFEQFAQPLAAGAKRTALTEAQLRQRIMHRAIWYLSRREYARLELKQKLSHAFSDTEWQRIESSPSTPELIESVLEHLAQNNWQSDARFANQISKTKGERYGSARVKQTLNQKGLAREIIDEKINELAESEPQRAYEVWQKKFGQLPTNSAEYAKQTRFMAYRGFSFDLIKKILKGDIEDFE
jgi:regulatory protein